MKVIKVNEETWPLVLPKFQCWYYFYSKSNSRSPGSYQRRSRDVSKIN